MTKITYFLVALCVAATMAHPGEHHDHEAVAKQIGARDFWASHAKRSISQCESTANYKALAQRSFARRSQAMHGLREKRDISTKPRKFRRDLATLETFDAVNHNMTGIESFDQWTPETALFGANTSCILTPEVTDGPYYVVGEQIRHNVKEEKYSDGVDVYLEVQYLDVNTCEPVPNVAVDIWNANATGVYSGISESGNFASDGWNSTYLRGVQFTDAEGVVSFETIFPGHYDGRATHTHLLAHSNSTINANGTLTNGTGAVTHIGQLFYPESLRSAVEAVYPYTTNTQAVTSNDDDMWSIVQAGTDYDPYPEFTYIGECVEDGLLAWIQIGINTTADYTDNSYYAVAAYYTAQGGYANEASSFNGGGGMANGTGNGTAPSGEGTANGMGVGTAPSCEGTATGTGVGTAPSACGA